MTVYIKISICMEIKFVNTCLVLINDCDAANNSVMASINPLTSG